MNNLQQNIEEIIALKTSTSSLTENSSKAVLESNVAQNESGNKEIKFVRRFKFLDSMFILLVFKVPLIITLGSTCFVLIFNYRSFKTKPSIEYETHFT